VPPAAAPGKPAPPGGPAPPSAPGKPPGLAPFAVAVICVAVIVPLRPFVPTTVTVSPGCTLRTWLDAVRVTFEFASVLTRTVVPELPAT
jgi:hypothetical protein